MQNAYPGMNNLINPSLTRNPYLSFSTQQPFSEQPISDHSGANYSGNSYSNANYENFQNRYNDQINSTHNTNLNNTRESQELNSHDATPSRSPSFHSFSSESPDNTLKTSPNSKNKQNGRSYKLNHCANTREYQTSPSIKNLNIGNNDSQYYKKLSNTHSNINRVPTKVSSDELLQKRNFDNFTIPGFGNNGLKAKAYNRGGKVSPSTPLLKAFQSSIVVLFKGLALAERSQLFSSLFETTVGYNQESLPMQFFVTEKFDNSNYLNDTQKIINSVYEWYTSQTKEKPLVQIPDIETSEIFIEPLSFSQTGKPFTFVDTLGFGDQATDIVMLTTYKFTI
jgi:hypothetical protein